LAVTTLQTDVGQLIGTVQYMSPEQIEADPHDIDIRSDVYALGILLHELLVEKLPYNVSSVSVYEAARIIREEPPSRLSSVNRALRGDLETITFKALEKNRERRYQSTAELGQDIRRFLNFEPISARPPSLTYQLRSFSRRHRTAFATAMGVVLMLVLGIFGTSWGMIKANQQSRLTEDALIEAKKQERLSLEAQELAVHEATRANTINDFLKNMLTSIDPRRAQGREVTVRDLLDEVSENVDVVAPDDPELEADLRATIGMTYYQLGHFKEAESQHRVAAELRRINLGEEHALTLTSKIDLALILNSLGRQNEAERLMRKLLEVVPVTLGPMHVQTLRLQNSLAWLLRNTGRVKEAEPLFRLCVEGYEQSFGEANLMTLKCMTNLGGSLIGLHRLEEAEPLITRALRLSHEHFGPRHPDTLYIDSNMAWLRSMQGNISEATEIYQRVVIIANEVMGEAHPHSMYWANELAWLYSNQGKHDEALDLAQSLLGTRVTLLEASHPDSIESQRTIATILYRKKEYKAADEHYALAEALAIKQFGPSNPDTLSIKLGRAFNYYGHEQYELAKQYALECVNGYRNSEGETGARTQNAIHLLVSIYTAWEKPEEVANWEARLVSKSNPM
ncbi:MAG: tetratricopeptide repeat protein, partial [Planctomycetota bacterium]|nr:tetratricopeptide repeat protein [Planctomycetota bacterium]